MLLFSNFRVSAMDHYVIVEELGKGTHGTIWKTMDKVTSKFWAMKRVFIFYLCPALTRSFECAFQFINYFLHVSSRNFELNYCFPPFW